jgi:hypothetical protein
MDVKFKRSSLKIFKAVVNKKMKNWFGFLQDAMMKRNSLLTNSRHDRRK